MSEELDADLVQKELPFVDELKACTVKPIDYKECLKQLLTGLGVLNVEHLVARTVSPERYHMYGLIYRERECSDSDDAMEDS